MKQVIGYIRDRDGVVEVRRVAGKPGDIDGVESVPVTSASKLSRIEREMDGRILEDARGKRGT